MLACCSFRLCFCALLAHFQQSVVGSCTENPYVSIDLRSENDVTLLKRMF